MKFYMHFEGEPEFALLVNWGQNDVGTIQTLKQVRSVGTVGMYTYIIEHNECCYCLVDNAILSHRFDTH